MGWMPNCLRIQCPSSTFGIPGRQMQIRHMPRLHGATSPPLCLSKLDWWTKYFVTLWNEQNEPTNYAYARAVRIELKLRLIFFSFLTNKDDCYKQAIGCTVHWRASGPPDAPLAYLGCPNLLDGQKNWLSRQTYGLSTSMKHADHADLAFKNRPQPRAELGLKDRVDLSTFSFTLVET